MVCKCESGVFSHFNHQFHAQRKDKISINVEGNQLKVKSWVNVNSFNASFDISYCPFCGKELKESNARKYSFSFNRKDTYA